MGVFNLLVKYGLQEISILNVLRSKWNRSTLRKFSDTFDRSFHGINFEFFYIIFRDQVIVMKLDCNFSTFSNFVIKSFMSGNKQLNR